MSAVGSSRDVVGFGPGKVILLGEHAVVYGEPALAGALSWGVTARGTPAKRCALALPPGVHRTASRALKTAFDRAAKRCGSPGVRIHLESDLPMSMGLGSSAAVSVAVAKALLSAAHQPAYEPTVQDILGVALEMEREFHGAPSGVDHTCSAHGRLILFKNRPKSDYREVSCPKPLKVLVALVGPRGSTRQMVADLRDRSSRWEKRYQKLFRLMGELSSEGRRAVESGDLELLGDLMNENQGLLSALGVSSDPVETMVHRLRGLGALGAKLTGAGGSGGAVIALFREPEPAVARLTREGVRCFASQLAGPRAL
jgi:mevalonate kinase